MTAGMCRNCGFGGPAKLFVLGWCHDCWRAFWKGAAAVAGGALAAWLFR